MEKINLTTEVNGLKKNLLFIVAMLVILAAIIVYTFDKNEDTSDATGKITSVHESDDTILIEVRGTLFKDNITYRMKVDHRTEIKVNDDTFLFHDGKQFIVVNQAVKAYVSNTATFSDPPTVYADKLEITK